MFPAAGTPARPRADRAPIRLRTDAPIAPIAIGRGDPGPVHPRAVAQLRPARRCRTRLVLGPLVGPAVPAPQPGHPELALEALAARARPGAKSTCSSLTSWSQRRTVELG